MTKELISNRKARYHFEILETYEAGIVLTGSEIKSLRDHGGNIQDAYISASRSQELFLLEASIAPYKQATFYNHEEKRKRKLLLHKREIQKLIQKSQEKGLSIIALSIYLQKGRAKVKIALVRGKKSYDKRKAKIEKEKNKEASAALKRKNLGSF